MSTAKNTSDHPVTLADGRTLAPGDWAEVPLNPHNRALLRSGELTAPSTPAEPESEETD